MSKANIKTKNPRKSASSAKIRVAFYSVSKANIKYTSLISLISQISVPKNEQNEYKNYKSA